MAKVIVMPKLGLTMKEGKLMKWLVKEGDTVKEGDALFEISTDKLTNSYESTVSGMLLSILVQEGTTVPCMEAVGVVGELGEDISEYLATGAKAESKADAPSAAKESGDEGKAKTAKPAVAAKGEYKASPAAKKRAKELGVDISLVVPEKGNRISQSDVDKFFEGGGQKTACSSDKGDLAGTVNTETRIPMSNMREIISERMSASKSTIPEVSFNISCELSEVNRIRAYYKSRGEKVSYTDILIKIVSKALLKHPMLNARLDGSEIVLQNYVNMGVAVALEDGLMVPVIKNSDRMSIRAISDKVKDLADGVRNGTANPDDMTGATFTITNLGMYSIESFNPIINMPELAILGVNKIEEKFVNVGGQGVFLPFIGLSLSADHRVIDGAVAAAFLFYVKEMIENPALWLD